MFHIFGRKKDSRLEKILEQLAMNASNNYKDAAQQNLREFEKELETAVKTGRIKENAKDYYEELLTSYQRQLNKFTHNDQKASW